MRGNPGPREVKDAHDEGGEPEGLQVFPHLPQATGTGKGHGQHQRDQPLPDQPETRQDQGVEGGKGSGGPEPGPEPLSVSRGGRKGLYERCVGQERPGQRRAVHPDLAGGPEEGRSKREEKYRCPRPQLPSGEAPGQSSRAGHGEDPQQDRGPAEGKFRRAGQGNPGPQQEIVEGWDHFPRAEGQHLPQGDLGGHPPAVGLIIPEAPPVQVPGAQGQGKKQEGKGDQESGGGG